MSDKYIYVNLDLNGQEIKNVKAEALTSEPTGAAGRMYYNTTTGLFGVYDSVNTEWKYLGAFPVDSVNGQTGVVVLDADDIDDTSTTNKFTTASDISKLAGIEANADVTDATNVAAAGATMDTDTSLAGNSYFLDEDNMASDSATKVPSQQSVKAYADTKVAANSAITGATKTKITYDSKGLVTAGADLVASDIPSLDAAKITTGTFDIARLPAGAVSKLVIVADQTARFALTTTEVQNGDSVKQTDTDTMYYVVDDTNLDNSTGYEVYTAETDWSLISSKPQNIVDIAAITPVNDDIIQVKSGGYVARSMSQLKTDLVLVTNDVTESTDKNYISDAEGVVLTDIEQNGVTNARLAGGITYNKLATAYVADFASGSFSSGVLTIAAATHGLGASADLEVTVKNSASEDITSGVIITTAASGDVTITVNTGLEFNGRIIIKRIA